MGPDGKPIPYWLYKLHGLNQVQNNGPPLSHYRPHAPPLMRGARMHQRSHECFFVSHCTKRLITLVSFSERTASCGVQEFKCEICGNASYWGRRAFERHFKEYLHQNGMRALGIPNTKLFFEVTKISDAQELWKNVQVTTSLICHQLVFSFLPA